MIPPGGALVVPAAARVAAPANRHEERGPRSAPARPVRFESAARRMIRAARGHPETMEGAPVIVQPPGPDGGRRVTIRGEYVGIAYHLLDIVEFLRRAGLPEASTTVDDPELIEWRGIGPRAWTATG